jgi:hypothetical protein
MTNLSLFMKFLPKRRGGSQPKRCWVNISGIIPKNPVNNLAPEMITDNLSFYGKLGCKVVPPHTVESATMGAIYIINLKGSAYLTKPPGTISAKYLAPYCLIHASAMLPVAT